MQNVANHGIDVIMPHSRIGLPNFRGYCFLIPAIVTLFCHKEFVHALIKARQFSEGQQSICKVFFALYSIYIDYKKASREGELKIKYVPEPVRKAYGDILTEKFCQTSERKDYAVLDRSVMKLVMEFGDRYDKNLSSPGYNNTLLVICHQDQREGHWRI